MATSKEFRDYVVEQLSDLGNITCRPMMVNISFTIKIYYLEGFMMRGYLSRMFLLINALICHWKFLILGQSLCI